MTSSPSEGLPMARLRATVSGRRTGVTGWLPVKASATGAQPEAWAPVSRVWDGPSTRPRSTSSWIAFSALTNWEPEAIGITISSGSRQPSCSTVS